MSYQVRFRALSSPKLPQVIKLPGLVQDVSTYMNSFAHDLIEEVRTYPPPPANSSYERTNKLYEGWRVTPARETATGGIELSIVNDAHDRNTGRRYMRYVQGPWQTAQHASTGWKRIDEARRAQTTAYRRGIQQIIGKHLV